MRVYSLPRIHPKILLVEDEPIIQRIHKRYLEKMDCAVDVTDDSIDALLLSQKNYDLILVDIGLPHLNGIDLAAEIRHREQICGQVHTPIIAITIYDMREIQQPCKVAGIDEIVLKPVSFSKFQQLILRWLPITSITAY